MMYWNVAMDRSASLKAQLVPYVSFAPLFLVACEPSYII